MDGVGNKAPTLADAPRLESADRPRSSHYFRDSANITPPPSCLLLPFFLHSTRFFSFTKHYTLYFPLLIFYLLTFFFFQPSISFVSLFLYLFCLLHISLLHVYFTRPKHFFFHFSILFTPQFCPLFPFHSFLSLFFYTIHLYPSFFYSPFSRLLFPSPSLLLFNLYSLIFHSKAYGTLIFPSFSLHFVPHSPYSIFCSPFSLSFPSLFFNCYSTCHFFSFVSLLSSLLLYLLIPSVSFPLSFSLCPSFHY